MFHRLSQVSLVVFILAAIGSAAACAPPAEPPITPSPSPEPSPSPAVEAVSPLPASPLLTPPSPLPSPTPVVGSALERAAAFYAAGTPERKTLHVLTVDGLTEDLGDAVYRWAAVSEDGRWFATSNSQPPADSAVALNLETGTTHTVPIRSGFDVYGMTFDSGAPRLAFLELGLPDADPFLWAMVVVDLDDGTAVRLHGPADAGNELLPGNPLGCSGIELLLGTFVPHSGETSAGVWSITVPVDVTATPVEELGSRRVLAGESYLFQPELSPEATRLLYLNRDYDYTPEDYDDVGLDLAVNQLWLLDLAEGSSELLVEETEGGALGWDIAWSPDGALGLFAEGRYAGSSFDSLTLKTVDSRGTVTDVGPVPLPEGGDLISLDWCTLDAALVVVATGDRIHELHSMDLASGESSLITSYDQIAVLGCVDWASAGNADADVTYVRAVESPDGTWTFHVTVQHPDTGWDDYADGWDVVTPDGDVLKVDPKDDFTRTLLHPHVDEQPFTRSQSNIVIPEGVTKVRVRAHDIVNGYGGREVVVDLTRSSGPAFEVERE